MRAVLYATLAKAELSKKLSAVLGNDLKVVDTPDQLAAEIPEADALFMGDMLYAGKTREAIMTTAKKLKWIQILTAGYDNAKQFGVPPGVQVTNVGDALAPAVGLHAVSLLLTMQRQVPFFLKNQEKHGWDRSAAAKAVIPLGQTCAVLGFGHIGREIARLMRALGSHVVGVSRTGAPDSGADEMQPIAKLDDVLKRSDSIMISLPLDNATHHLINARTLALCKKNAIIVNIARGGLIDQIALTEALKSGTIAGAGLDVTDPEPLPPEHPLWDAPNLYISPHFAGGAGAITTDRISGAAADNLVRFQRGEALKNVVKV
ncbi:MAG TPA: D-2-hydroxyacid dehydrogenase [Xanthobacteraceae bacterium]|jgi:phosphoglycerate dehydrogenase-like enzyme|nr:D-2-hydroxyacid dehydrogenase [Xanthobacteraceae bacterium]